MTGDITLSKALMSNLLSLQRTQTIIDRTTQRLATGLRVNSALDDSRNFFDARALNNRASDLNRLLDGISQSIRTIEEGVNGVEAIEQLLRLAENVAVEERESLLAGDVEETVITTTSPMSSDPLNTQILAQNPVAYWRLNETSGNNAINLGSIGSAVNGTYVNNPALNAATLYNGGSTSVDFNGLNQFVNIPDNAQINSSPHDERTIELVFNADTTAGRQVLYEEGAAVNSLTIYIFNGELYVTGRDQGAWGPADISMPIVAGQTYHVAFTFDSNAGEFIGYVNGVEIGRETVTDIFPSHTGNIGIGAMNESAWFHDGSQSGNGFYFDGRISDVAIYNDVLTATDIANHAGAVVDVPIMFTNTENVRFNNVLDQITQLAIDASYRGINLLQLDDLTTLFNENGTSFLLTEGVDFSSNGLGILRSGFDTVAGIEIVLETVRAAIKQVQEYGRTLAQDFSILTVRDDFTIGTINILRAGALDLTIADVNEEGANLLATQARQQLSVNSLSLLSQGPSVVDLFT
nr:hypothetical protein [Cytophagales bacterium]